MYLELALKKGGVVVLIKMGGGGSLIPFPHTHRFVVLESFSGVIGGFVLF